MTEKSNVVYIDNKEYKADDLSQEQKYFIEQLTECQAEAHNLKKATDRIQIAQTHFMSLLKTSLSNDETVERMENTRTN